MPKPRTRERWEHSLYKEVYCIERNGKVYTVIKGQNPVMIAPAMEWNAKNKKAALAIAEKRLFEHYGPEIVEEKQPKTIAEAWDEFLDIESRKLGIETRKSYFTAFNAYLVENYTLDQVNDIFMMLNKRLKDTGHSPNTQLKYLSKLRKFFDYCVEMEYMNRNPVTNRLKPDEEKVEVKLFTPDELETIYEYFLSLKKVVIPINADKSRDRKRSEAEEKEEYAYMLMFIATAGTRGMETLHIWHNVPQAPYVPYSKTEKSIILPDRIIIDGKRKKHKEPNTREFPLTIVPQVRDVLYKCEAFKQKNNGKLFRWNALFRPEYWLKKALVELKLDEDRSLHSLRKTAINWWEKTLGIPEHICVRLAGHTQKVRTKHYDKKPTADELVNMYNTSVRFGYDSKDGTGKNMPDYAEAENKIIKLNQAL